MPAQWKYFAKGESVKAAGVKINKVLRRGANQTKTRYEVVYSCCGEKDFLTHARIRKRERMASVFCVKCARTLAKTAWERAATRDRPPLQIALPTWPVPPSSVELAKGLVL